jgi:hypothetical protein
MRLGGRHRLFLRLLCLFMLCALARDASAQARPASSITLAILKPHFEEGSERELGVRALQALASNFEQQGYALREVKHTTAELPEELRECQDARCATQAARLLKADVTLHFTLLSSDERPSLRVVLFDRSGSTFEETISITDARPPEHAALDAFIAAMSQLQRGLGPVVTVTGVPEGAEVVVNDRVVGIVPYVGRLEAGRALVAVRHAGFVTFKKVIEAGARVDQVHSVVVDLEQEGQASDPRSTDAPYDAPQTEASALNYVFGSALAAGAIGLIVYGVIAAGDDGECEEGDLAGRCSGEKSTSTAAAIALASGGVLAVGAGVLFIVQPFVTTTTAETTAGLRITSSF